MPYTYIFCNLSSFLHLSPFIYNHTPAARGVSFKMPYDLGLLSIIFLSLFAWKSPWILRVFFADSEFQLSRIFLQTWCHSIFFLLSWLLLKIQLLVYFFSFETNLIVFFDCYSDLFLSWFSAYVLGIYMKNCERSAIFNSFSSQYNYLARVSWILVEDRILPGQRQRTLLPTASPLARLLAWCQFPEP